MSSDSEKIDLLLKKIEVLEAKISVTESAANRMEGYIWILDRLGRMIKGMNPLNLLTQQDEDLTIEDATT